MMFLKSNALVSNIPITCNPCNGSPKNEVLSETMSEIVVPISIGREVLGVLDVQSNQENAFTQETADILVVLSNQVAAAVQNFQLKASTEVDLLQVRHLYRASRIIAQAKTLEEIRAETAKALDDIVMNYGVVGKTLEFFSPALR